MFVYTLYMSMFLNQLIPPKLPEQAAEIVATFRRLEHLIESIDQKLTPLPQAAPAPVDFEISASGHVTSQQVHVTSILISADTAGAVTLTFGNSSSSSIYIAANSSLQLRWTNAEALIVARGLSITASKTGGGNFSCHVWAFVD